MVLQEGNILPTTYTKFFSNMKEEFCFKSCSFPSTF